MEAAAPPRLRAAAAGAIAALAALAAGELLAGMLAQAPSPVVAVGDAVIDLAPRPVREWGIDVFGTADKPALVAGIVILSVIFGAGLGRLALARFPLAAAGFAGFGIVGLAAALRDPEASALPAAAVLTVAALTGMVALHSLQEATVGPGPTSERRRAFLRLAGGWLAGAGVAALSGRWLARRMEAAAARSGITLPAPDAPLPPPAAGTELAVPGLAEAITPNQRFYRIDTALTVPVVDLETWRLTIDGMVRNPLSISYAELLDRPLLERYVTLACVSNEVGGDLVGNAKWLGVSLRELLEEAGPEPGAEQIVGRSVDGFTVGFPVDAAFDGREALVAVGMNDEPLPTRHGFPARLVVAGLYGYVSATKWLEQIELTTWEGFDAYWIPRGWAKEAPIKTQSRIDVPAGSIGSGRVPIAGVAWAPGRGISRVEVQVDDEPWRPARLSEPLADEAWRQWSIEWEAEPGTHTLRVRATDGTGATQPARPRPPRPDGATGYHTVTVIVA